VSRAAASALAAALLAAGCASKPPASPDAAACLAEVPSAKRTSDYAQRLASLKTRAAFFAGCMEARGYELNEAALQDESAAIPSSRCGCASRSFGLPLSTGARSRAADPPRGLKFPRAAQILDVRLSILGQQERRSILQRSSPFTQL
jgi:hypothetical protein